MTKKMTYVDALNVAIEAVSEGEVVEKLEALKDRISKKSKGEKKPTKVQRENEVLRARVLEGMEVGKAYTITELFKMFECAEIASAQKMSALVRQLKDNGLVAREEVKGKAYFTKVEG